MHAGQAPEPALPEEPDNIRRCFRALAGAWSRPVAYTMMAAQSRFREYLWTINDGTGRRARWMLRRRDGQHIVASETVASADLDLEGAESIRLTMHASSLRPAEFVSRQQTRIEIERGDGSRPIELRLDSIWSDWTTIVMLTTDRTACQRRLVRYGRENEQRVQREPAERCGIVDTFGPAGPRRICRPDPEGHRRRVDDASALRASLEEDQVALCAAIGSLREVVECFPPALLTP